MHSMPRPFSEGASFRPSVPNMQISLLLCLPVSDFVSLSLSHTHAHMLTLSRGSSSLFILIQVLVGPLSPELNYQKIYEAGHGSGLGAFSTWGGKPHW